MLFSSVHFILLFCLFVFLTNRCYGTLSTGFVYGPEKAALLPEGGNQEFYKLKITVKNHMTLAGGQLHFEVLTVSKMQVQFYFVTVYYKLELLFRS